MESEGLPYDPMLWNESGSGADFGLIVETVRDVADAIRIMETRPDIRTVFTDLDMRGPTAGMALALSIRDRWPPIELLMVSSQPWDAAQIPARGVVFGKPFDRRRIVAAIQRFAA